MSIICNYGYVCTSVKCEMYHKTLHNDKRMHTSGQMEYSNAYPLVVMEAESRDSRNNA